MEPGATTDLEAVGDRALLDALFTSEGRSDPQSAARANPTVGCRYHVVDRILRDPRTGAAALAPADEPLFQLLGRFMARIDGDRHHAVRSKFARIFTPRKAAQFATQIESRAHVLVDDLVSARNREPCDLVAGFARPLPFGVIADVMGIPASEQPWLEGRIDAVMAAFANQRNTDAVTAGSATATETLAFFESLIAQRRAKPADDVLSVLAIDFDSADDDARADVLANCFFFITAGQATTTALLAGGAAVLCTRRDHLALLGDQPAHWGATVEELLRYLSPITITGVSVPEAITVDGVTVQPGPNRLLSYAAANRDPSVFDGPDEFDPSRPRPPHLAFSVGTHHCLGAPLARLHGTIGLRVLFERLPTLRSVTEPQWRSGAPVRQIDHHLVTW